MALWMRWRRFRPDARAVPAGETEIVTISLYEASVGVFVPYLGNLSGLLDHASAHAEARNIDPAVLLNMRLYPNMYSLKQQVGEANRHAVVACALLAGRAPHTFSDTEPDIAELKSRISAAIDFVQGLPRAEIDGAADKEVVFTFKNGAKRKFTGQIAAADVQRAAVLLSRHDGLRHPAPRRRRSRQEGFSGAAEIAIENRRRSYASPPSLRTRLAAALRPVISLFNCSKRRRASLSRSSTIWIAASLVIGPVTMGIGILADGLVDIILAIVEAHRPFETDRGHRSGTEPGVAVRLDAEEGSEGELPASLRWPTVLSDSRVRFFRLIENAGDGRKRMIGRVALSSQVQPPDRTPCGGITVAGFFSLYPNCLPLSEFVRL